MYVCRCIGLVIKVIKHIRNIKGKKTHLRQSEISSLHFGLVLSAIGTQIIFIPSFRNWFSVCFFDVGLNVLEFADTLLAKYFALTIFINDFCILELTQQEVLKFVFLSCSIRWLFKLNFLSVLQLNLFLDKHDRLSYWLALRCFLRSGSSFLVCIFSVFGSLSCVSFRDSSLSSCCFCCYCLRRLFTLLLLLLLLIFSRFLAFL